MLMKKMITSVVLLAAMATSAMAQSPYGNITDKNDAYINA